MEAWRALGKILSDGGSWSGHERNCCFLNTHGERFADVSSAVGFDHDSDSRAVALVDWDHDGDLDVWTSNRTSPRVRFLQNTTREHTKMSRFLQIRLQGTNSNRDAIGTRLVLTTKREDGTTQTQVQTLRAGEGYLAQSSKWVHFGLGKTEPTTLEVRWPSGATQSFEGLDSNTRLKIIEGEPAPQPISKPTERRELASKPLPTAAASPNLRIVSSRRLPIPQLQLIDAEGDTELLNFNAANYTLLTLWASWCQPCVEELQQLQQHRDELKAAGIRWVPVSVDELDSDDVAKRWSTANGLLNKLQVNSENKLATKAAVECLDVVQKTLTSKKAPLPVPCSFLVDSRGKLIVVYKGTVESHQVLADVKSQEEANDEQDPRALAVPFPGRWVMNTFPADLMSVASGLRDIGRAEEALHYMLTHISSKDFPPPITKESLTQAYLDLGSMFLQKGSFENAERAALRASKVDSNSSQARLALGEIYLVQGRKLQAVKQYRELLKIAPKQPMALNNLAWLLATSQDDSLRDPQAAVGFAQQLCELTKHSEPVSLDTYSVALAANGEFEKAIETLRQAMALAKKIGKPIKTMEERLKLFEAKQPYRE